jgi:hypothetical protein
LHIFTGTEAFPRPRLRRQCKAGNAKADVNRSAGLKNVTECTFTSGRCGSYSCASFYPKVWRILVHKALLSSVALAVLLSTQCLADSSIESASKELSTWQQILIDYAIANSHTTGRFLLEIDG